MIADEARARTRQDYRLIRRVPLRWNDVDVFGHVNNAVHYALMDTAVCGWLEERLPGGIRALDALNVVAETGCRYFGELHFSSSLEIGMIARRIGSSSVEYELGFFVDDRAVIAVARFVHVYVDPSTRRPSRIPPAVLRLLEEIV